MHSVLQQRRDRAEIMRLLVKLVNAGIGVTVTVDHSNARYGCLLKTDAYGCWHCCRMKFGKSRMENGRMPEALCLAGLDEDAFKAISGESACLAAKFEARSHVDALRNVRPW